jgi:hypothetical protein
MRYVAWNSIPTIYTSKFLGGLYTNKKVEKQNPIIELHKQKTSWMKYIDHTPPFTSISLGQKWWQTLVKIISSCSQWKGSTMAPFFFFWGGFWRSHQCVPINFSNVFPKMFPIAAHFYTTCLARIWTFIYLNHKGGPNGMLLCWGVPNVLGKKRGYGPIKVAPSKTKTKLWIQPPTN